MPLAPGVRIGPYEIVCPLGEGGMGEVYRARDTKLGRDVALKLLPSHLSTDPDRLARLSREARLLAALNHPYVATIHGLEEAEGHRALVMELVEGPTLADKLVQSATTQTTTGVPVPDALRIAGQIAEGLEAAHDKGIIHRDLKPANIKLSRDGSVRLLDFGLAKAFADVHGDPSGSPLPTITATGVHLGSIVGTPAYMSPEQARGQAVDKQTDVWAFGCVLFELLAGRSPFPGKTITDTIAAILERDPDWSALPAQTPPSIRQLLRRCLEKDANRRLHDIADARIEIEDARSGANEERPATPSPPAAGARLAATTALIVVALAVGGAAAWFLRPMAVPQEARLDLNTEPTRDESVALSPDGRTIAYVVASPNQPQLWLRRLDSNSPRQLAGTEHATCPFWSPDGRSIGFFAGVSVKSMEIDGGSVHTLSTRSAVPLGGTWNRDGVILFADNPGGPILRVAASGGEPVAETRVEPQQRGHFYPSFLPDGRHFLFFVSAPGEEARGVYLGELGGAAPKRLFSANTPAVYASGHLVFVRNDQLLAQRFNADRGELQSDAFPVDEHLAATPFLSASVFGSIAWRTGPPDSGKRQLVWFDRSGKELDKVVYPETAAQGPAMSADGNRIAVYRFVDQNMDIWSYDVRRRTWDRLTFHPGDEIFPLWSPDGKSLIYGAVRTSSAVQIFRHVLSAPPDTEELLVGGDGGFPTDWSPDGKFLLYSYAGAKTGADIYGVRLDGDRKPFDVVKTEFSEGLAVFAPDGKWIAYESNKTGRLEVYLRPFPGPGPDVLVSTEGGSQARWNPAGKELFYVAEDDKLMLVPITVAPDGQSIEPGKPTALFTTNIGSTARLKYRQQYVVSPDGKSFVMQSVVGQGSASPISVILNWKPSK